MPDNRRQEEFTFDLPSVEFCNSDSRSGDKFQGKNLATSTGALDDHICQWGVREYETLWLPFRGLAKFMSEDNFENADKDFAVAITRGQERIERGFLPFVWLWRGRLADKAGKRSLARQHWEVGVALPEIGGATHYQSLLTKALEATKRKRQ